MADVSLESWWILKGGGVDTDADSTTWRFKNPTAADTISWDSGSNTVDSGVVPARPTLTETKFNFPPAPAPPGPAAKTLVGMAYTDTGVAGTTAVTTGGGNGALVPGFIIGNNWKCSWNLRINVTPGAPAAAVNYDIEAEADDPLSLTSSNFDDNTHGLTSFYLPVSMKNLSYENGGGGMSMSYNTAGGMVELLNLSSSASSGVKASGDEPDFLKFYLINQPYENPMFAGARPYSLSELKDVLSAKMNGSQLTSPLMLGVLLENIPVPTGEIATGGIVAEFHIKSKLREVGGSPMEQQKRRG